MEWRDTKTVASLFFLLCSRKIENCVTHENWPKKFQFHLNYAKTQIILGRLQLGTEFSKCFFFCRPAKYGNNRFLFCLRSIFNFAPFAIDVESDSFWNILPITNDPILQNKMQNVCARGKKHLHFYWLLRQFIFYTVSFLSQWRIYYTGSNRVWSTIERIKLAENKICKFRMKHLNTMKVNSIRYANKVWKEWKKKISPAIFHWRASSPVHTHKCTNSFHMQNRFRIRENILCGQIQIKQIISISWAMSGLVDIVLLLRYSV